MKKLLLSFVLLMFISPAFAQDDEDDDKDELDSGWTKSGDFSLMINQSAFNNDWMEGGTSNFAGDLSLDYKINYKEDRFTWITDFLGEYGLTKLKNDNYTRKTNDRIEINSVAGYKVAEDSHWSYSFLGDFRTQFTNGYEYGADNDSRIETTRFMSPGYLKFGPGMLYENGDLLELNIAPATSRFIFVNDRFTTVPGYEDGEYYGVDQGKSSRFEFGASLDLSSKITLVENVDLKNRLSLFSDYLDKPQNIDIDYRLKIDMKINEYLSTNFIFQAIYQENAVSAFQIRETLGVGFSYKLN